MTDRSHHISWNVNGIRAISKKGFADWLRAEGPDVLCLQETKAELEQFPKDVLAVEGYHLYASSAEKKGYSGTATFTKVEPEKVEYGIGEKRFDSEGRFVITHYEKFILFNIYFPNGGASTERLQYKLDFYDAFLEYIDALVKKKKNVVFCGDVNTAHREIDLARPKENEKNSGFMPIERAWIDRAVERGWVDTFRMFNDKPEQYTWWDYKTKARERNIGWRIDYFFANKGFADAVMASTIMPDVEGSDHCPVALELKT
ncbi:MAG TPA: exodeoxyribonuclease III [Spirochaetota bacterium]|nr:exodeoxyribonuclease III [Spirochaetota bacterium]